MSFIGLYRDFSHNHQVNIFLSLLRQSRNINGKITNSQFRRKSFIDALIRQLFVMIFL